MFTALLPAQRQGGIVKMTNVICVATNLSPGSPALDAPRLVKPIKPGTFKVASAGASHFGVPLYHTLSADILGGSGISSFTGPGAALIANSGQHVQQTWNAGDSGAPNPGELWDVMVGASDGAVSLSWT